MASSVGDNVPTGNGENECDSVAVAVCVGLRDGVRDGVGVGVGVLVFVGVGLGVSVSVGDGVGDPVRQIFGGLQVGGWSVPVPLSLGVSVGVGDSWACAAGAATRSHPRASAPVAVRHLVTRGNRKAAGKP